MRGPCRWVRFVTTHACMWELWSRLGMYFVAEEFVQKGVREKETFSSGKKAASGVV